VLALVFAVPAIAQPADNLQREDALVQSIGWRLSHAALEHETLLA